LLGSVSANTLDEPELDERTEGLLRNLVRAKDKYEAAIAMQPEAARRWEGATPDDRGELESGVGESDVVGNLAYDALFDARSGMTVYSSSVDFEELRILFRNRRILQILRRPLNATRMLKLDFVRKLQLSSPRFRLHSWSQHPSTMVLRSLGMALTPGLGGST
jgi:hypothetical protein